MSIIVMNMNIKYGILIMILITIISRKIAAKSTTAAPKFIRAA